MAKSLQQFREWAEAVKQCGNPGTGSYPGQCVSLVQQYLNQVFDIPYAARGNAVSFVPPTFVRVSSYRPGDIIRYGARFGGGDGHIGIIDDNGHFLEQNGQLPLHISIRATPYSGYDSIWRPTKAFNIKTLVASSGLVTCVVPSLNVRNAPKLNAAIDGVLRKGQVANFVAIVTGDTYTINGVTSNQWYKSRQGHYYAKAGCK